MIGNLTNELFLQFLEFYNKEENQQKLKNSIIDPILKYISKKTYPYFLLLIVLLIIMNISLIVIFYKIYKN
jgi:hypothetical protein